MGLNYSLLERTSATERGNIGRETLSVIIPALNEEKGIADIVRRIQSDGEALRAEGVKETEILVVDDGSEDNTCGVVNGLAGVRLIRHGVNRGYGAAIKTGFCQAKGDVLAFLDADGTYPPEHFHLLYRAMIDDQADIVVGSRRSGEDSQMPKMRRLGNWIWSNLVSALGESRCADPASGMRLLRRDALPLLYPLPDGLNFTPVMSTRSVHENLKVVEVGIPYAERVGRSKLSIVHDGLRFLKTILWTALEYNPAKILGVIGVLLLMAALIMGAGVVALRAAGTTTLGLWGVFSVFTSLVCAVAGLSIYALGVTSNFIIAKFNRQPIRMGLFRHRMLERMIEPHFGWLGAASVGFGVVMSVVSVLAGGVNWDIERVWLWLLGSALFILVGSQLAVLWTVARIVDKLSVRSVQIEKDLGETAPATAVDILDATAGSR